VSDTVWTIGKSGESEDWIVQQGQTSVAVVHRSLAFAAAGLLVAVAAVLTFDRTAAVLGGGTGAAILSLLVTWIPLAGAVLLALFWPGQRESTSQLGLRLLPVDLLWGLGVGLAARLIAALLDLGLYGTTGLVRQPIVGVPVNGWFILTGLLAPVVIAPFIEEAFFRGLLQGSLTRTLDQWVPRPGAAAGAVFVTSALFGVVHVLGTSDPIQLSYLFATTFLLGIGTGVLAARSGRIGGAFVAHVVFNGIAVALTWPS
jgi:membrane protease YdiL (CAAX protease family)